MGYYHDFSELKGRKIVAVDGLALDSEDVTFTCEDGSKWRMYHSHDCCESVRIADIVGDVADAIGTVMDAREETSDTDPEGYGSEDEYRESFTWTFYLLQTDKGHLTIRWLGESNGYYGETAEFRRIDEQDDA